MPSPHNTLISALSLCAAGTHALAFLPGDRVCINGTAGVALDIYNDTSIFASVLCTAPPSEAFSVTGGPVSPPSPPHFTWFAVSSPFCTGWAIDTYLAPCGGPASRWNRFGVGLVSPGDSIQWPLASSLAGPSGWILLIFPGIDLSSSAPDPTWVAALHAVYALNLNAVVRLGPPWGGAFYRDMSDDSNHRVYTSLAAAFKSVVQGLPAPPAAQRLWLQVDNEVDLCYEWACSNNDGSTRPFQETAAEYSAMLKYVIAAVRGLQLEYIMIGASPMSPGGCVTCGCCGAENCPADSGGITGLQFMAAMDADVWPQVDFLASHSYPASGIGYGFNAPMPQALPGLNYFDLELAVVNRSLQVLMTETGWATAAPGLPPCSEQDKATWTVDAYNAVWLNDSRIAGVMPFMLMDPTWGDVDGWEYVHMNGTVAPVYSAVQALRQSILKQ